MRTMLVLLAGGSGERMGAGRNKVLLPLRGKSIIRRSMEAFEGLVDGMVLVCREADREELLREAEAADCSFPYTAVTGGRTRQQSVLAGLQALDKEDLALVHDGARCLADPALIRRVIASARDTGSGVPAIPATDTIKIANPDGTVQSTPDRSALFQAQTPQGFPVHRLLPALLQAEGEGFTGTDDASLLEWHGDTVRLVEGSPRNIKLTTPEDLRRAVMMLDEQEPVPFRVGTGYDVHRLVTGRKLILCGVEIPHEFGLLGHSDADVALHALMDALLGAAPLRDIGRHFPDTDPRYSGISSLLLLAETLRLLREAGFAPVNADVTIVAQKPKLLPYIPEMKKTVAAALSLPPEQVNIKATTTESLGFEGRKEGISAQAVCLIQRLPG